MTGRAGAKDDARRELLLGATTLAIAIVYYLLAIRIPQSDIEDVIGPQGLPKTYAALMAGLSILLIARAVRAQRTAAAAEAVPVIPDPGAPSPGLRRTTLQRGVAWRIFGMLMNGVIYILVVPWLGYILSIAALIAATVYYQGGGFNRRIAAVAIGGALFLWLLFVRLLHISHPPGIWPSLL